MKKLFLFLLITFCVNTVNAQFELKGYLQTSFGDDQAFLFQEKVTNTKAVTSLAYNQKNKNFHQFTFVDFYSGKDANLTAAGLEFGYSYNFALWKQSEKWLPFIGPEVTFNPQRTTLIPFNNINFTKITSSHLMGELNINLGVQYKISDNVRLELGSVLNFYDYEFYSITEETNGNTNYESGNGIELNERMDILRNMPINLGILVRFGSR